MSICTYQNHAANPAAPMQFTMLAAFVLVFAAKIKFMIPAPYVSTGSITKQNIIPIGRVHDIVTMTGRTMEAKHIELIIVAVVFAFIFLLPSGAEAHRRSISGDHVPPSGWKRLSLLSFRPGKLPSACLLQR